MNILAIAKAGVDKAWSIMETGGVLTQVTVRDYPTFTRDPETEAETVSAWGVNTTPKAFLYGKVYSEFEVAPGIVPGTDKRAILRVSDFPAATALTTNAELVEGAVIWHVSQVEAPPGEGIFILHLRK